MKTSGTVLALLLVFAGCRRTNDERCAPLRYDPVTRACACVVGEFDPDGGVCVEVDGGRRDADAAACSAQDVCNGADDDCDGVVDGPQAARTCSEAAYALGVDCAGVDGCLVTQCAVAHADCDREFGNGCEANLGTRAHCGSCSHSCGWVCASSSCNDLVMVTAGDLHSCALRSDRGVVCWGDNSIGQLGDGSNLGRLTPVLVQALDVIAIAAGAGHTCAVHRDGTVSCWGDNGRRQLGRAGDDSNVPVAVPWLTAATSVTAGESHSCAIHSGGRIQRWGSDRDGQISGAAWSEPRDPGRYIPFTEDAVAIDAGHAHTCALFEGGILRCWGSNLAGQIGTGAAGGVALATVVPLTDVTDISSGGAHSCAITGDGRTWCWGSNSEGQLGTADLVDRWMPVEIDVPEALDVSAGGATTCIATRSNEVYCWGAANGSNSPQRVEGLGQAAQVSAGGQHACAIDAQGTPSCWGANHTGQVGNGDRADTPVERVSATAVLAP